MSSSSVAVALEPALEQALFSVYLAIKANHKGILKHQYTKEIAEVLGVDAADARSPSTLQDVTDDSSSNEGDDDSDDYEYNTPDTSSVLSVLDRPTSQAAAPRRLATELTCLRCSVVFDDTKQFLEHIVYSKHGQYAEELHGPVAARSPVHQNRDQRFCQFCDDPLGGTKFSEHVRTEHPHSCYQCNEIFEAADDKTLHDVRRHDWRFVCPWCHSAFKTDQALDQHQKVKDHLASCKRCIKTFRSNQALEQHNKIKHGHDALRASRPAQGFEAFRRAPVPQVRDPVRRPPVRR